ncbi:MAG: hypothetical protein ACRERU_16515 [Methylococcales bacterium]
MIEKILNSLRDLYLSDQHPWIIGYCGGKDSTMVASLILEMILSLPKELRQKEIEIVCTDTRVEIPAVVGRVANELCLMQQC